MFKYKFQVLLMCVSFFCGIYAQAQNFSGTVYLDANKNNVKDKGEKGIPNILVSNGQEVIRTDKKGKFSLAKLELSHFVTLHVPANYDAKQFYIKTSENRTSYDFALTPKTKKENFEFVQISDTETYMFGDWLNDLKEYVKTEKPAFVIHTGDICYEKGLRFHHKEVNTEKVGGRVLYCVGNHDLVDGGYGEELYEELLGPAYYSFEEGNTLFVVTPMLSGDRKPSYTKKQIYTWLKNLLVHFDKKQPKYFFNHDILTQGDTFNYGISDTENINLGEHNLKAWVYGHHHSNHMKEHGNTDIYSIGTASTVKGGIDHAPSCFRVINIDENGDFKTQLRYTSIDKEITIVSPKTNMLSVKDNELKVSVNTYHTASATVKVRYGLFSDDYAFGWFSKDFEKHWHPMTKITDWNWNASWEIPDDGFDKGYRIIAEATLKNGNVIRTEERFHLTKQDHTVSLKENWTNLAYNAQHTGNKEAQEFKMPLNLRWMQNTKSNIFMCSPIYADGKVFIATSDDNNYEDCYIVAYNADSGEEKWKYRLRSSIKNTITYSDGFIMGTDSEGITYALNGATGELAWKKDLGISGGIPAFLSGIASEDHVVYTGWGKGLSALNVKDGSTIWKNKEWHGGYGSVATHTVGDDVLIASANWSNLFVHDKNTGKLLWKTGSDGMRFRESSTVIVNDTLYATANKNILLFDVKTGKKLKQKETGYRHKANSAPLITDKYIIIGTADKGVLALHRNSLEEAWNFKTNSALFYTSPYTQLNENTVETTPILSKDKLFFGASDGYLYVLDVNTGHCLWKRDFGAPIFSTVALSGNMLFVADFSGNLYAFTAKNQ
jgi:outer membrane protein assembly factor BamB/predicted phosphodiesterase